MSGNLLKAPRMYEEYLALNGGYAINPTKPNHIYLIYIYKEELALNNLQWLIWHKIQTNQFIYI